MALAISFVQADFGKLCDRSSVFFPLLVRTTSGMRAVKLFFERFEFIENFRRQSVVESECDEISGSVLPPVRQMSRIEPDWHVGIEGAKAGRRLTVKTVEDHGHEWDASYVVGQRQFVVLGC